MQTRCKPWCRRHLWNQYTMTANVLDRRTLMRNLAELNIRVCDRCGKVD